MGGEGGWLIDIIFLDILIASRGALDDAGQLDALLIVFHNLCRIVWRHRQELVRRQDARLRPSKKGQDEIRVSGNKAQKFGSTRV